MTRTASPKKAPAIPALMPLPEPGDKGFWSISALNDDAKLQAIEALERHVYKERGSSSKHTTSRALCTAFGLMEYECHRSFNFCRLTGNLLLAWRGSKALPTTLPASLEGGAA